MVTTGGMSLFIRCIIILMTSTRRGLIMTVGGTVIILWGVITMLLTCTIATTHIITTATAIQGVIKKGISG